jgi:hypothetical protein
VGLLTGVTQARQPDVQAPRTEQLQEVSDVPGTAHWHHGNALSGKIATTARSERLERGLVADPLNEHDRLWVDAWGQGVCRRGNQGRISAASQRLDGCQLESPLVVHLPSLVSPTRRASSSARSAGAAPSTSSPVTQAAGTPAYRVRASIWVARVGLTQQLVQPCLPSARV